MAIFHLTAKVISRGKGQSAIAAAAYRSGERLYDEQAAQQKYYPSRDERIVFTDIMAPKDAPEWAHDRDQLWNHAERAEKRKDAQLAREIEVSLPHELNDRQREWLIKDFAREEFVRKGYAVDIAIHAPDKTSDERNYHAHLMITTRRLGPEGFAKSKESDQERAAKREQGWTREQELGQWRERWAHLANRHLERHGHAARIDHRSLKEQGIDREATVHLGYAANEMAQRGAQSDKMDALRAVLARNEIRVDMKVIERELRALESEQAKQQKLAEAEKAKQAAPQTPKEPPTSAKPESTPSVPIEDINARHAAAERDHQQAQARKQAAEKAQREQATVNYAKGALNDPYGLAVPNQAPPEGAKQSGEFWNGVQDRRDARQDQTQKAWSMHRDAEVARVKDAGAPRSTGGLQVMNRATGVAVSLGDFVSNLLDGSPAQPEPKADMRAFVTDPAARKTQQLARLAASRREQDSEKAIESIREDREAGRNLKPEDISHLTRQHQEQIRSKGDSYVQEMVDDARKRADTYWKGKERERD